MDNNQQIQSLLAEIRDEQRQEAERARIRWTRLTIALVVAFVVAVPAVWTYIHNLLVVWF